jgi:uncharacterized protein with PIN domain
MELGIVKHTLKEQPKFLLDGMLGSLARWLRLLGYDTLYCETQSDDEILEQTQHRILLTRDTLLLTRAQKQGVTVINPGSGSIEEMLQRLQDELGIRFLIDPNQSRCPQCNSPLLSATREEIQDRVPQKSLIRHHQFWQCVNPQCRKVYWQGRHWVRIQQTLDKLRIPEHAK